MFLSQPFVTLKSGTTLIISIIRNRNIPLKYFYDGHILIFQCCTSIPKKYRQYIYITFIEPLLHVMENLDQHNISSINTKHIPENDDPQK